MAVGLCARCQNRLQLNTIYMIPSNLCAKLVEVARTHLFSHSRPSERNNLIVFLCFFFCWYCVLISVLIFDTWHDTMMIDRTSITIEFNHRLFWLSECLSISNFIIAALCHWICVINYDLWSIARLNSFRNNLSSTVCTYSRWVCIHWQLDTQKICALCVCVSLDDVKLVSLIYMWIQV